MPRNSTQLPMDTWPMASCLREVLDNDFQFHQFVSGITHVGGRLESKSELAAADLIARLESVGFFFPPAELIAARESMG